jgi:hypothetical protein
MTTISTTRPTYALLGVVVLAALWSSPTPAQQTLASLPHETHDKDNALSSAFVKLVREATARFRDVRVATAEGYGLLFGCVSGPDIGAMGMHFVNGPLTFDGELDATRPEIVIYEPASNGRLRLIGADYLVLADAWHANHESPPELMGQLFHLFESPNRFGLPAFYTLHVWAWKENPSGTFVNWHPNVSCDGFDGETP